MGPDQIETPRTTACPSCGAALRPGAPWCTLCYVDLRPAPEAPPAVAEVLAAQATVTSYGEVASDPLTQPLVAFLPELPGAVPAAAPVAVTWPCGRCQSANPLSASVCSVCGGGFLATVRDEEQPLLVLPLVGDVGAMSRAQRLGLAAGLVLAILLPLALITLLLTDRPEASSETSDTGLGTRSVPAGSSAPA